MALHIAAHREGFTTAWNCAAEGLLACMRVRVDPERRGAGEGLLAFVADVAVGNHEGSAGLGGGLEG